MSEDGFINRLIRSVVTPANQALANRRARQAGALCHALLSERGEVSGALLAREALAACRDLPESGLATFFDLLADDFSPSPDAIAAAYETYREDPSPRRLIDLQRAVESPRQELFRRLNMAPGGTPALIAMREAIHKGLRGHPSWAVVDADLQHLFSSWFNRGFLTLQRIDWRTSALVLEKLIRYEAVHEITGWADLHRRLEADRRCFAFFHPALPDEPLIFIEVALTRGISSTVQPLLDLGSPVLDPESADSAVFYSITNCQSGLRGVSFGNLLIKQVAQQLGQEFPRLRHFATLSPVPGFRAWLEGAVPLLEATPGGRVAARAVGLLQRSDWIADAEAVKHLEGILLPLCAYYLVHGREDGESIDPVARFHLGNGARLERVNWLADTSSRGIAQSAGVMVNYVYRLEDVERNHEVYVKAQQVVASRQLQRLARSCPLAAGAAQSDSKSDSKTIRS